MKHIQEIIIVEGRSDTRRLKEVFFCDTIETGGSAINESVMKEIEVALASRGAIIFTDPDFPGKQIRQKIVRRFPTIKEAFLHQKKARGKGGKLGIEHARDEDLIESLSRVYTNRENSNIKEITIKDMVALGLSGSEESKQLRIYVCDALNIGYSNATQMRHKLNRYGISKTEVKKLLHEREVKF